MKNLILFLLMFSMAITTSAKPGKIKYGKYLIYEGEVTAKKPSGTGILRAINPDNKKEYVFTIEGAFDGMSVTNPHITSQNGMPEMNVKGTIDLKTDDKIGKVESITLTFSGVHILESVNGQFDTEFTIESLAIKQEVVGGSRWEFSYTDDTGTSELDEDECFAEVSPDNERIDDFNLYEMRYLAKSKKKVTCTGDVQFNGFKNPRNVPTVLSVLGYRPLIEYLGLHITDGKFVVDYSFYSLNKLNTLFFFEGAFINTSNKNNKISIFCSNGDDWDGQIILDDGTIIKKQGGSESVTIKYGYGKKYVGTISGGSLQLARADCNISDVDFQDGYYYQYGDSIRILLGEHYDDLHNRLKSELCDSLVEMVETRKITESEAISRQKQIEKERQVALRAMLNSHWGADAVLFSGKITSTEIAKQAWIEVFGLDPAYFVGEAILGLDCYGEASFSFIPMPSENAYNKSRTTLLQLNSLCKRLTNIIKKGKYEIVGNTLYIDRKSIGTFSDDWQTFTHDEEGALITKMRVTEKEKISEDGSQHTIIK